MPFIEGDEHSWNLFFQLDPQEVRRRTGISFDPGSKSFLINSFGQDITISHTEKKIGVSSGLGDFLIRSTGHFFDLALLWYLISCRDIPLSDELIRPSSIRGGQIFVTGSHVLPLDLLAEKYGSDRHGFVERGRALGGETLDLGDAAIRLYPFPRVPVTFILWQQDDEFPARVDFFFDSTCDQHLATDVLWATAMVSCIGMGEKQ